MEPQNEEINAKKITAVKDAIYAVTTRKPQKKRACWDSNPDLCNTGAVCNQRACNPTGNWSLNWSKIYPGKIKDEITNTLAFFLQIYVHVVSLIGIIFFAFHLITF